MHRVSHAAEGDLPDASHPGPARAPQHAVRTSDGVKVGSGFRLAHMQAWIGGNWVGKGTLTFLLR